MYPNEYAKQRRHERPARGVPKPNRLVFPIRNPISLGEGNAAWQVAGKAKRSPFTTPKSGGGKMPFVMPEHLVKTEAELADLFNGHKAGEQRPAGKTRDELDSLFKEQVAHLRACLNCPLIGKTPNTPKAYKVMEESQFFLNKLAVESWNKWATNPAEYRFGLFFRLLETVKPIRGNKIDKPFYKRVKNMRFSSAKLRGRW